MPSTDKDLPPIPECIYPGSKSTVATIVAALLEGKGRACIHGLAWGLAEDAPPLALRPIENPVLFFLFIKIRLHDLRHTFFGSLLIQNDASLV